MNNKVLKLHKISNGFKALLLASVLLAGCGESDASAGEGGSSWLGKSVEFDITAKPHFEEYRGELQQKNLLVVLSKNDEKVKITDVIVNRGNCKVYDVGEEYNVYSANEEREKAFFEKHPEYDFIKEGKKLPTKEGKLVEYYNKFSPFFNLFGVRIMNSDEYFNDLTEEAQAIYDKEREDSRKVLGFGGEATYSIGCSPDSVLEVTIKTDRGEVSYKMGGR